MEEKVKKVKCSIFVSKNEAIEKITKAINETSDFKRKKMLAKDLAKQAEELLTCKYSNQRRIECGVCQEISKIRLKTAQLIIKAAELKT